MYSFTFLLFSICLYLFIYSFEGRVTTLSLEHRPDARYFKIDANGVIRTSQTIAFRVNKEFTFAVYAHQRDTVSCFIIAATSTVIVVIMAISIRQRSPQDRRNVLVVCEVFNGINAVRRN